MTWRTQGGAITSSLITESGNRMEGMFPDESVVSWKDGGGKEGGEGCRPYVASPQNTEGDGSLCYVTLPHPPAPVLHKHRGLVAAPVWTLHNSKARHTLRTQDTQYTSGSGLRLPGEDPERRLVPDQRFSWSANWALGPVFRGGACFSSRLCSDGYTMCLYVSHCINWMATHR